MIESNLPGWVFSLLNGCVLFVFVTGILCFFFRREYVRQVVGLKLMLQSVSLGLISSGYLHKDLHLAQTMVISALIIEAIIIGLALTMIVHITEHKAEEIPIMNKAAPGQEHDG